MKNQGSKIISWIQMQYTYKSRYNYLFIWILYVLHLFFFKEEVFYKLLQINQNNSTIKLLILPTSYPNNQTVIKPNQKTKTKSFSLWFGINFENREGGEANLHIQILPFLNGEGRDDIWTGIDASGASVNR